MFLSIIKQPTVYTKRHWNFTSQANLRRSLCWSVCTRLDATAGRGLVFSSVGRTNSCPAAISCRASANQHSEQGRWPGLRARQGSMRVNDEIQLLTRMYGKCNESLQTQAQSDAHSVQMQQISCSNSKSCNILTPADGQASKKSIISSNVI